MIIGTGIDIVEVSRIKRAVGKWGNTFLRRIFTEKELRYSENKSSCFQHLAARFAVKEAVLKAFGDGWTNRAKWCDIGVWNEESGKPNITLSGDIETLSKKLGVKDILISISHTRTYAVANVMLVNGEGCTGNRRMGAGLS
ncbi:MAG: holo-ACP synthase [Candidatus Omnitrophota bacterium]